MLPENDLIVFRRGMYATYGKKVRYYAEKKLAARTKIPAPAMPAIRVDPAAANNSPRVIQAAENEGDQAGTVAPSTPASAPASSKPAAAGTVTPATRRLNRAAIDATKAAPPGERTAKLFEHLVTVEAKAA